MDEPEARNLLSVHPPSKARHCRDKKCRWWHLNVLKTYQCIFLPVDDVTGRLKVIETVITFRAPGNGLFWLIPLAINPCDTKDDFINNKRLWFDNDRLSELRWILYLADVQNSLFWGLRSVHELKVFRRQIRCNESKSIFPFFLDWCTNLRRENVRTVEARCPRKRCINTNICYLTRSSIVNQEYQDLG